MSAEVVEERAPHEKYAQLMARAAVVKSPKTIVVHPCDETSLRGAIAHSEEAHPRGERRSPDEGQPAHR